MAGRIWVLNLLSLILLTNASLIHVSDHLQSDAGQIIAGREPVDVLQPVVLPNSSISRLKPFTFYASTAYCRPNLTRTWKCGRNCDANPSFHPVASGGDGSTVQYWYVGFDPKLKTIVVGHQGTDVKFILPLIMDTTFWLTKLDAKLFPDLPDMIRVHRGFAQMHANAARSVLEAVEKAVNQSGFKDVTLVGHSLGAALALLDSLYLPLHIPDLSVRMIGYALPRVGNEDFAYYVSEHVNITHVTNKKDPVPILPGRFLGFQHPRGEQHIQEDSSWFACPGHDNPDKRCIIGSVPNVFVGKYADHLGPYDGVNITCQ